MSAASKMRALVERVRNRAEKSIVGGSFGYGICPADAYVRRAVSEFGPEGWKSIGAEFNAEQAIKDSESRLTYCDDRMTLDDGGTLRMEKTASPGSYAEFLPEDVKAPPHTLMLLKYTLTGPTKDRDGDILRTEGAVVDPRGPLLWQHMFVQPIGKHLRVTEHTKDGLKEVSALLDLNDFTEDIAKMIEADVLRFSHGFQAMEWEEIKGGRGGAPTGFDVKKFEVIERSLVSCPSNTIAMMELYARQKFHSPAVKSWAKGIYDSRPALVRGFCLKHSVLPSVAARIPEKALRAVADADERQPIRWAKSLPECFDREPRMEGGKLFDPAGEKLRAATLMHEWVSKYLEVPVKRICESHASVPSAKVGAWLTALDAKLTGAKVDDVRNISGDVERPPQYEAIQLTSAKSDTFLVDGTRFARFPEMKCVLAVEPTYFGLQATLYTDLDSRDANINFFNGVQRQANEYKFLKGEAFSLSGDFLTRDGSTTWDDVFLVKKNETAVRHATAMLQEKGADMPSRGVLMLGPPGSGKTMSGRAMMNECKGATFIWVAARDFYMCGSFGGFSYAFDMAKELAPSIIFFEDVDNWMRDTAIDLLKTEMDGLTQNKGILTVLTTNHPEQLPKALIDRPGRFHDVLLFDNPTEAVRDKMIARWLPDADAKQRSAAVKRTDGWSGAHVYELCAYAKGTAEQDKLETGEALVKSLDKIAEQRDLIDEVQGRRSRYEPMAWERAATDLWLKGKAADEETPEETDEPDPEEPTMLVCDNCGHEMKAPEGYDAEKPMTCPECEEGKMLPKSDKQDGEETEDEPEDEEEDEPTDGKSVDDKGAASTDTKADDEPPADEPKPDEEEPAAKSIVCEDCGYKMPLDEAEADEDGAYECPKCGGKMNPMGEKSAVEDPELSKRYAGLWNKCTSPGVSVAVEQIPLGKSGSTILTTTVINVACKAGDQGETASRCFAAADGFFDALYRKAGRVLSQRNMDALSEAAADLEEAVDIDKVPRKCAALVERALKRLKTVIESSQPVTGDEARPDARPKEPAAKNSNPQTLAEFLATAKAADIRRVQEILDARLEVIKRDARADALKAQGLI